MPIPSTHLILIGLGVNFCHVKNNKKHKKHGHVASVMCWGEILHLPSSSKSISQKWLKLVPLGQLECQEKDLQNQVHGGGGGWVQDASQLMEASLKKSTVANGVAGAHWSWQLPHWISFSLASSDSEACSTRWMADAWISAKPAERSCIVVPDFSGANRQVEEDCGQQVDGQSDSMAAQMFSLGDKVLYEDSGARPILARLRTNHQTKPKVWVEDFLEDYKVGPKTQFRNWSEISPRSRVITPGIRPFIGVITPFTTGRGPPCRIISPPRQSDLELQKTCQQQTIKHGTKSIQKWVTKTLVICCELCY